MKGLKFIAIALCSILLLGSCTNGKLNNTGKGTLIGTGAGAALGAAVGAIFGGGTGAAIGAAVGGAVGAGTGAIIGNRMDKAKKAAEAVENAKVESVKDANNLEALKVTFDGGILFASGKAALTANAQKSLSEFANTVLKTNPDMDVTIQGYSDNDSWKGCNAQQSAEKNLQLSQQRAQAVSNYLTGLGVKTTQLKSVDGYGEANPVADNSTAAGKALNRRVEVFIYASEAMIKNAEAQQQ